MALPSIAKVEIIDQKWSPRAIPIIIANVITKATARIRIMTLYRRPSAMPANALIIANPSNIALTIGHGWSTTPLGTSKGDDRVRIMHSHHAGVRRQVNQPEVSPMRSQKGRRLAGKFLSPNDFLRMRQPQAGDAGLGNEVLRYEAFIKDF